MFKKSIITGIGIIVLLMLAGGAKATPFFFTVSPPPDCAFCHKSDLSLKPAGVFFNATHRFNGTGTDLLDSVAMCPTCHVQIYAPSNFSLTFKGQFYNSTHRYNDTTLASTRLDQPGCYNCHVDIFNGDFTRLTGTPTYLTSTVCQDCHKAKYDDWRGTNHANKLMPSTTAQADNLPLPAGYSWANVSYVVVGITGMYYINESGYISWKYNATAQSFSPYIPSHGTNQYSCGSCHTTGYNANGINALPGIVGTWSEPGIACERCHGPGGNGHQVQNNASTAAAVCTQCHAQANVGAWATSKHATWTQPSTRCTQCHSPFDYASNKSVTSTSAEKVVCAVCHNPHDVTLDGYRSLYSTGGFNAGTMASLAATGHMAKNSFFNSTASLAASRAAGFEKDIYDNLTTDIVVYPGSSAGIGSGPINLTGRPQSEVLCSKCHYNHGIAHIAGVNLTHGKAYGANKATCVDCHMATSQESHSFNVMDTSNFPSNTCSRGTQCHITSSQNLNKSAHSVVPVVNEWKASAHNDKQISIGHTGSNHFFGTLNTTTGIFSSTRQNYCLTCHSPFDWDPAKDFYSNGTVNSTTEQLTSDFKGITCAVCHNFHDMGDWLTKTNGKAYGWYNKKAISTSHGYQANYTMMANTTQLCGNCHTNKRYGNEGPGWNGSGGNPTSPHGIPAADVFAGSWKQTGLLNFECIDCHMATTTDSNNNPLPDSQKVRGHSFQVNVTLLESNSECSGCHVAITGSTTASKHGNLTVLFTPIGNISQTIAGIQAKTQAKWNTTNATVMSALNTIKAYNGEKNLSRTLIAQAYWNLRLVSSDESWGVHNPTKINGLLDDAVTLANQAVAALPSNLTATTSLVSSITPTSRNAVVGTPITVFMSVINGGTATATGVSIAQASSLPVTVSYQQWNGTAFTGTANTPADLAAGATANYVLTVTATSAFTTSPVTFNVSGTNAAAAPISGVNTLTMAASTVALPDVIMMATGALNYKTAVNTTTAFAVATSNVGASATGVSLIVSVPSSITGLIAQVNQTNPATGAIIGPATGLTIGAGAQPTFAVFLTPTQPITQDLVNHRITLQLKDGSGNVIGAQSVAIYTT